MYAAEAGRLEVRFQNRSFLNKDDIHNQLLFLQLGGAVVTGGIRRGKMGRGGQSRAEKQIRQARSIFFVIFANTSSGDQHARLDQPRVIL